MGKKKNNKESRTDADLRAVQSIIKKLNKFDDNSKKRIIRWVNEKLFNTTVIDTTDNESTQKEIVKTKNSGIASVPLSVLDKNPHGERPIFNKVIVQDEDETGNIMIVPSDPDLSEPPEADILKPVKEKRKLIEKVGVSADGKIISRRVVMAK